jgi:hypothetical protein
VHVAAEAALEDVLWFHLHAFGALAHFVADLGAIVADVVLRVRLAHLLEQPLRALEVLLHEDLRVVVRALAPLLAVTVHVVPAQLAHDVLELAHFAVEAEAHVEVGATLVDVAVAAVFALLTALLHKIGANFEIMAEVALVPVPAGAQRLELVTGLNLALVVRVGAVVRQPALTMDEPLADPVGRQLVVVRSRVRLLHRRGSLVLQVEVTVVLVRVLVHHHSPYSQKTIYSQHRNLTPTLL